MQRVCRADDDLQHGRSGFVRVESAALYEQGGWLRWTNLRPVDGVEL